MTRAHTYLLIGFLLFLSNLSSAQSRFRSAPFDDENTIYKNEWSMGLRMHTNGFTTFWERVWIKDIWKRRVFQIEYFYYKDFKEKKQNSIFSEQCNPKKFVYGKKNNFFAIHVNYGNRKTIGDKAQKAGVRLMLVYMGGVSLGFLKPYYLEFFNLDNTPGCPSTHADHYRESDPEKFLDINPATTQIFGGGGVRYGFNKIRPVPGIHGKFGFNFDWAAKEYIVKALELGMQVDIYYKKLDVMINDTNRPYIFNFYLSMQMGKRWSY